MLVALVIIYAVFATIIAVAHLAQSSAWVHLLYFFVTGILWVLPAMGIIWWMAQPPRKISTDAGSGATDNDGAVSSAPPHGFRRDRATVE